MMKSLLLTCVLLFSIGSGVAVGDELDQKFSKNTPQPLVQSTRQMIQAGMADDDAVKLTREMQEHNFRLDQALRAQQIVIEAHKQGWDADAVVNKAFEGMTKGVPDTQIVMAMEKVSKRQTFAKQKAGEFSADPARTRQMSRIVAAGLTAGIKEDDMEETVARLRARTRTQTRGAGEDEACAEETFKTLRDMARLGVDSKTAAEMVGRALERHYGAKEMQALRLEFTQRSMTGDAQGLAQRYTWSFRHGQDIDSSTSPGMRNGFGGPGGSEKSGGSGSAGSGSGGSGSAGSGSGGSGSGGSGSGGSGSGGSGSGGSGSGGSGSGGSGSGGSGSGGSGSGGSGSGGHGGGRR